LNALDRIGLWVGVACIIGGAAAQALAVAGSWYTGLLGLILICSSMGHRRYVSRRNRRPPRAQPPGAVG
jgi:membrane protein implicated in regulation of membrane protease activity